MEDNINFDQLSRHEINGGNIKNCIFRAAARAALRYTQYTSSRFHRTQVYFDILKTTSFMHVCNNIYNIHMQGLSKNGLYICFYIVKLPCTKSTCVCLCAQIHRSRNKL